MTASVGAIEGIDTMLAEQQQAFEERIELERTSTIA